jgi:hypothetical protein
MDKDGLNQYISKKEKSSNSFDSENTNSKDLENLNMLFETGNPIMTLATMKYR